jgi:cytochrome c peroxidase
MPSKALGIVVFSLFCLNSFAQEALPTKSPSPADNPITQEKVLLGKMLFFDPRLSKDGTISCNSCHNVMAGGVDNKQFSAGVGAKLGGRNSPTVWNSAFLSVQFWDGRANSLEDQAKGPLTNPVEMAMKDHNLVIDRIVKINDYKPFFDKAFGPGNNVNIDNVAKAIASYERTLITPNSRFDKYLKGDKKALSAAEINGFETAKQVGCFSCHSGPNLAGPTLPVGTGFYMKFPTFPGSVYDKKYNFLKDKGRFEVTKNPADKNMFRVQSLRNIELTAPYFHNGAVSTLEEAVRVMGKTQLNKDLSEDEVKSLVMFLKTLTGEFPEQTMPRLPGTSGFTIVQ